MWPLLLLLLLAALILPAAARADGTPDIALSKDTGGEVLYGETSPVTLTVSNPTGEPIGFNLSFRDVLPPGVSYVPGSSSGQAGDPQVINDAPTAGETTLIWSNVADLTPSSSYSLTFQVQHDTSVYAVGDTYTDDAGAYINCDPSYEPDFDANGLPTQSGGSPDCSGTPPETSYTGSATASAPTTITAIQIDKDEPSPESELLRGLHDQQTVYTLTVTNNSVDGTDGVSVEDYIPAGLEFLGCGTDDNTTDAPTNPGSAQEYPGSGPINPGNAPGAPDCVEPDSVQTVADPPGHPAGIYTHVTWDDLGDLAAGGTITLQYVAAIPIRANTLDWNGTGPGNGIPPLPGTGNQASNLDNNSGPETNQEGTAAPAFTNEATATGSYQGPGGATDVSDDTSETVTAQDVRILKSVSSPALGEGEVSTWTLKVDTGEYRFLDDLTVTDTLGDGYCPLSSTNLETTPPPSEAECDPTGDLPSAPYTSADEQADGSWDITWDSSTDPGLARIEPSSTHTITFPTRTRANYQENFTDADPVLSFDEIGNDVDVAGDDWIICAPGDPSPTPADTCGPGQDKIDADEADGTSDGDDSTASQSGDGPTLAKDVDPDANTGNCLNPAYGNAAPSARPGDTVCFRLRMTFPAELDSADVFVADLIPAGTEYVAGSTQVTPANTAVIASGSPPEPNVNGDTLIWPLGSGGSVPAGSVFEVTFKIRVDREVTDADGDITANLMKATVTNSDGTSFTGRDDADIERAQPEVTLTKGVRDVNDGAVNPPDTDNVTVQGGDEVTFRVDVTNDGSIDADDAEIWDVLPAEISCADVPAASISNGGTCNAIDNRIEWTGIDVAAGATTTLTYDVDVPDTISPGQNLVNTAGVREYESASGTGPFTNIPEDNIDPTQEPNANAGAADDPSNIRLLGVGMTKSRTTSIDEAGNDGAGQATIGEVIDYTVTTTIPAGSTLYGPTVALTDPLGSRQELVGTPTGTIDDDGAGGSPPVPLPANGISISSTPSSVTADFPAPYVNASGSGDDIVVLTFSARVLDLYPDNYAQGTSTQQQLPNTATLGWSDSGGGAQSQSAGTSTEIVEPDISIDKSVNTAALVTPGQTLTYTVTGTNGNGARVSTAHDGVIVDHVPAGLEPVNGATPVADGGTVNPDGGTWDATARTITWDVGALAPGDSATVHYDARVEPGVVGGSTLTNTAEIDVSSLDGTPSFARTDDSTGSPPGYHATDSATVRVEAGLITKSVDPGVGTIGDQMTYTLRIGIDPNVTDYDVAVTDDLPDGLVFDGYVSETCVSGCSPGPTNITPTTITPTINGDGTSTLGWWLGDVDPAPNTRFVELVYHAHIADTYDDSSDVADGDTLTNTATGMFNLTDELAGPPASPPDPADFDRTGTDNAEVDVVEPELALDKDVSGDPDDDDARDAEPGDDFTYTLRVTNNGTSPAYDVTVTDQPDAELTNVTPVDGSSFVTDGWTSGDPDLAWLIPGPIAPGDTVTLTYTADLVPSAQLTQGQQAINTADVPSYFGVSSADRAANPGFDFREYDDVDADTVTVTVHVPDLTLEKTTGAPQFPDDAPAEIETPFPWRIVITNPNDPSDLLGVDLTDTLPANWSYVAGSAQVSGSGDLTPGGQVEPTISGGGATLSWSDLGNLEGSETIIVDFEAEPSAQAAIDPGTDPAANVNEAEASGEDTGGADASGDGTYADDDTATATLAPPSADLQVTKTATDPTPVAGGVERWDIAARNNGPQTAPDVVVTDTIPAGIVYVSATPEQGSCSFAAGTVTCDLGEMASGDEVGIALVTAIGPDQTGNTIVNPADVADANIDETDTTNNHDEDQIVPVAETGLVTDKELLDPLVLGGKARYRVTVTNNGPSVARDVVVTDHLPDELAYVSADDPGCVASGQDVSCSLGDIPPRQSRTVVITVLVVEYSKQPVTNLATVPGGTDGTDTGDIVNTDLALKKKGPKKIVPGKKATYLIEVTNVGDYPSGGTATVSDKLPKGLEPISAKGKGWDCGIAGRKVSCSRSDSLKPGKSWPKIKVRVEVSSGLEGQVVNTARVSLPGDPVKRNNVDSVKEAPESTCLDGSLYADPTKLFAGAAEKVTVNLRDSAGRPVKGVAIEVVQHSDGDRSKARTNGGGKARFELPAADADDRFVIRAEECKLRTVIRVVPAVSCRSGGGEPVGAEGSPPQAEGTDPRRRC